MTKQQFKIREEWKALNVQINSQLRVAKFNNGGKSLNEMPESEWKSWMIELINYRDTLTPLVIN